MEHSEATETMASTRYLLGEMTDQERNAFEEHYFGCGFCAQEVRDGSVVIDSIRAEGRASGRLKPASTLPWLVAVAAAIGIAFLGYQNAMLRRDGAPHVIRSYSLLSMGTRGANQTTIDDATKPFALYIDIPPQPPYPSYRIELRDASGNARVSVPVTADQARETITVYVPPRQLQPGTYRVLIFGGSSATISSAPLTVR
jgi:hypothetical protein